MEHDGRCILEAATIRPGDRLVVAVSDHNDPDGLRRMMTDLRKRFPDNDITMINANGIAVQRSEEVTDG